MIFHKSRPIFIRTDIKKSYTNSLNKYYFFRIIQYARVIFWEIGGQIFIMLSYFNDLAGHVLSYVKKGAWAVSKIKPWKPFQIQFLIAKIVANSQELGFHKAFI